MFPKKICGGGTAIVSDGCYLALSTSIGDEVRYSEGDTFRINQSTGVNKGIIINGKNGAVRYIKGTDTYSSYVFKITGNKVTYYGTITSGSVDLTSADYIVIINANAGKSLKFTDTQ